MTLADAQRNMRDAYYGGAAGLFASGSIWLAAAIVTAVRDTRTGIVALLLGGMLIHPLAVLLCKALDRSGKHAPGNPLAPLAIESTVLLMLGLAIAFALSFSRADLFFPAMLLVIGGRYLVFQTLYGLRTYWLTGALLAAAGFGSAIGQLAPAAAAGTGALIELILGAVILAGERGKRN
jgi:hypothetical protein